VKKTKLKYVGTSQEQSYVVVSCRTDNVYISRYFAEIAMRK